MRVRAADVDDADELASCIVASWLQAHQHQIPSHLWERRRENWTVDVSASAWRRTLTEIAAEAEPRSHVLVATEPERIVGLVAGTIDAEGEGEGEGDGEVTALYVARGHQRQGVGRRLLVASFEKLAAAGASGVRVGVLRANAPARQFYERLGGVWAGSAEFDEDGELLPSVVYRWPLNA